MADTVPTDEERTIVELTREECLALLANVPVGRVAVAREGAGPLVVPVNFVLDGDVVVFRTDAGTKLSAVRSSPISFEADVVDAYHRIGWSVLVDGVAYEATRWEIEHLDLTPWSGGGPHHWVRLLPSTITGRRIDAPADVGDERGYR